MVPVVVSGPGPFTIAVMLPVVFYLLWYTMHVGIEPPLTAMFRANCVAISFLLPLECLTINVAWLKGDWPAADMEGEQHSSVQRYNTHYCTPHVVGSSRELDRVQFDPAPQCQQTNLQHYLESQITLFVITPLLLVVLLGRTGVEV